MEQKGTRKNKKLLIVATIALAVLLAAFAWVYATQMPKGQAGTKTITLEIVVDTETTDIVIETDAEFLRGALEQENLAAGAESEYGLYVLTVNGVTADESLQQWWCFTKGGETLYTGIDTTPIADGDAFEATLMTGW